MAETTLFSSFADALSAPPSKAPAIRPEFPEFPESEDSEECTALQPTLSNMISRQLLLQAPGRHYSPSAKVSGLANHYMDYRSRHECDQARKRCIQTAYAEFNHYLHSGGSDSISTEDAQWYSRHLKETFSLLLSPLQSYCSRHDKQELFDQLQERIDDCYQNLLAEFEEELDNNDSYYALYDEDYFLDRVTVEEHDYRATDESQPFLRLIETCFGNNIDYSFEGARESIWEMEDDTNKHAASFHNAAYSIYETYISRITYLLEKISHEMPAPLDSEDAYDYLKRMNSAS
jgi:hypothetical protein